MSELKLLHRQTYSCSMSYISSGWSLKSPLCGTGLTNLTWSYRALGLKSQAPLIHHPYRVVLMQQLIWIPGASLECNMLKLKHGKFYNFLQFDISSFDSGNKKVSSNILRKHRPGWITNWAKQGPRPGYRS